MKALKPLLVLIVLALSFQGFAQDNVFLKRDFWTANPTIKDIEAKINEGHNIAQANSNNFDAVVYALLQNVDHKTIQYIQSKKGNEVNKLTHDGRTYIFWAAYKGNIEMMEYLLKNGAKTDLTDDKGNTILNFAASTGQQNTKVYDLCIANGADLKNDVNPDGANALLLAAPYDVNFKLIDYFTSKGLDINSVDANNNGIFNYVARTGNIELLNSLLKKGVKGNDQAFMFAAYGTRGKTNGLDVYNYLESLGLNPNTTTTKGETPLHVLAARSKNLELITYFIDKNADVNQIDNDGNSAFLNAASRNNLEVIRLLFSHVKDINAVNKKGESALALATANNSSEMVQFLFENNADISVIDANGNNLTYYLINSYNFKDIEDFKMKLELLQKQGLDITKAQKDGNTLFHLALDKNNLELLKWVNTFNVDVNAENNEGISPLHKAAMTAKNTDILKYLMSIGADKKALTEFEETVYDLASENEVLKENNVSIDFLK
ncbi:ankyrin repeat domain-containing protein [Lacinutrix iliipiscaria]|uniref:Ankyrin repeat domain-containing protein n=1 Tax=Lacinutrix iliipiscaria TaxID=1230532 RepID=A0ABW5WJ29_9FLAO